MKNFLTKAIDAVKDLQERLDQSFDEALRGDEQFITDQRITPNGQDGYCHSHPDISHDIKETGTSLPVRQPKAVIQSEEQWSFTPHVNISTNYSSTEFSSNHSNDTSLNVVPSPSVLPSDTSNGVFQSAAEAATSSRISQQSLYNSHHEMSLSNHKSVSLLSISSVEDIRYDSASTGCNNEPLSLKGPSNLQVVATTGKHDDFTINDNNISDYNSALESDSDNSHSRQDNKQPYFKDIIHEGDDNVVEGGSEAICTTDESFNRSPPILQSNTIVFSEDGEDQICPIASSDGHGVHVREVDVTAQHVEVSTKSVISSNKGERETFSENGENTASLEVTPDLIVTPEGIMSENDTEISEHPVDQPPIEVINSLVNNVKDSDITSVGEKIVSLNNKGTSNVNVQNDIEPIINNVDLSNSEKIVTYIVRDGVTEHDLTRTPAPINEEIEDIRVIPSTQNLVNGHREAADSRELKTSSEWHPPTLEQHRKTTPEKRKKNGDVEAELKILNKQLHAAVDHLSTENRELGIEVKTVKTDLEAYKDEGMRLSKRLGLFEERSRLLKSELQATEKQLEEASLREQRLTDQVKQLNSLTKTIPSLEKQINVQHQEISHLRQSLAEQTKSNNELNFELEELRDTKRQLISVEKCENELSQLQKTNEDLIEINSVYQNRLEEMEQQLNSTEYESRELLEKAGTECTRLKQELAEARSKTGLVAAPLSRRIWELEHKLHEAEEAIKSRTKVESTTDEKNYALQLEDLQNSHAKEISRWTESYKILEARITRMDKVIEEKTVKISELQVETSQSKTKERNLIQQLHEMRLKAAQLQDTIETLRDDMNLKEKRSQNNRKVQQHGNESRVLSSSHSITSGRLSPSLSQPPVLVTSRGNSQVVEGYEAEGTFEEDSKTESGSLGPRFTDWPSIDNSSCIGRSPPSHSNVVPIGLFNKGLNAESAQQLSLLRIDMEAAQNQNQYLEEECLRLTSQLNKREYQLMLAEQEQHEVNARMAKVEHERLEMQALVAEQREVVEMYKNQVHQLTELLARLRNDP